jgi:hypothetical protein
MKPEILIYLNQVKDYLKKNEEALNYFVANGDKDTFFEKLSKLSKINFEKSGEPTLSVHQFEQIRTELMTEDKKEIDIIVFTKYGSYSLN